MADQPRFHTYIRSNPKIYAIKSMGSLACAQLDRIEELISIKRNIRDSYIYELEEVIENIDIIQDTPDTQMAVGLLH